MELTPKNKHVPAPKRDREGHIPTSGDIYMDKRQEYIVRLGEKDEKYGTFAAEYYNFSTGEWEEYHRLGPDDIKAYYRLLLDDFDEIVATAKAAADGDASGIDALLQDSGDGSETLELVASRPADQVFSITESAERLQDKLETIRTFMRAIVEQKKREIEAHIRDMSEKLKGIEAYVANLHRIITVMNLYTGKNVALELICDGEKAPSDEPIHVRQRILFMDEEYLADAANGGIDYGQMDRFFEWLKNPANRDIICPEPKCVVALKAKRYDMRYCDNAWTNDILNKQNHHTIVLFRDGERLLVSDSEDLELYGMALPFSDQQERFEKKAAEIVRKNRFPDSELEVLKKRSEALGYMYVKYLSYLQGIVDNGVVFDIGSVRPNFAKQEGVVYVYDDENAIGTGRSWYEFQKKANAGIRRGTRVVFFPMSHDERGLEVSSGKPNRYYLHDGNAPAAPAAGIYNVDYPAKSNWGKNPITGTWERTAGKGDKLAIFYTPRKAWKWDDSVKDRSEAWIYNPWCVLNYDALTVEIVDEFLSDRTQRPSFLGWIPILQEARKRLVEEHKMEESFIATMWYTIEKDHPEIPSECIRELVKDAVAWWKTKVIFTRALDSDDAKAWRMIYKRCIAEWKKNNTKA